MSARVRSYKNIQQMYESRGLVECIKLRLEGHEYSLIGTKKINNNSLVQVYRCDKEQHNLLVYMRGFVPYLIKPIYSINGISVEEALVKHK